MSCCQRTQPDMICLDEWIRFLSSVCDLLPKQHCSGILEGFDDSEQFLFVCRVFCLCGADFFWENSSCLVIWCIPMHVKVEGVVWEGEWSLFWHELLDLVEGGLLFVFPNQFGFGSNHWGERTENVYIMYVRILIIMYYANKLAELFLVFWRQDFLN